MMNMIDSASALLRLHELKYISRSGKSAEEIDRIIIESERCIDELPEEVLHKYEIALRKHGKRSVGYMRNWICQECFIRMPTSAEPIDGDIYQCEHCGRLVINEG